VESAVKVFGQVVKVHRERAGMTQKQLGKLVFCSDSLLSGIENGTKPAKQDLVERIDTELNANGVILAVHPITGLGGYPSEFVASQEAEASKIHDWEPRMIPGLAQTPEYARAVMRAARPRDADEAIEADVQSRVIRQEIFSRETPPPPLAWFVIDESALYRPFGGKDVMRAQLVKLEKMAGMPSVVIQIMRFTATTHPGTEGPLRVIEFTDNPPIWYTEGWFSGRLTEARDEVSDAMTWFDLIRASALPPDQTMRLMAKVRVTRYE
jgi:transcriptional regulator with XRE-family HTH domain